MEAEAGIEPTYADLQSAAWPLCHSARRSILWQLDLWHRPLAPEKTSRDALPRRRRHGYIEGRPRAVKAMVLRPEGARRGVVNLPANAYKQHWITAFNTLGI